MSLAMREIMPMLGRITFTPTIAAARMSASTALRMVFTTLPTFRAVEIFFAMLSPFLRMPTTRQPFSMTLP